MKFALDDNTGGLIIEFYSNEIIQVNGRRLGTSFVLAPDRVLTEGFPHEVEGLEAGHFARIAELEPQVVLVGTGERQCFPAMRHYASLAQRGIGVEVMTTPAACRTYNILRAEGRRVCALLMIGNSGPLPESPSACVDG
jgi:uncharacterized protein